MPGWKIREASNGETALRLVDEEDFDLLFLDQYMSSAEKQLLGTETARKLRSKGVSETIICGLSANDMGRSFIKAGADIFLMKPFPCKGDELKTALLDVLHTRGTKYFTRQPSEPDSQKVSFALPNPSKQLSLSPQASGNSHGKEISTKTPLWELPSSSLISSSKILMNEDEGRTRDSLVPSNASPSPLFSLATVSKNKNEEHSPLLGTQNEQSGSNGAPLQTTQPKILSSPAPLFQLEPASAAAPLFQLDPNPPPAPLFQLDPKPSPAPLFQLEPAPAAAPLFQLDPNPSPAPLFQLKSPSKSPEKDSVSISALPEESKRQPQPQGSELVSSNTSASTKPAPLW